MPNWCNNSVTITHTDPAKITALADAFAEARFCEAVIPTPECLTRDGATTSGGANALQVHNAGQFTRLDHFDALGDVCDQAGLLENQQVHVGDDLSRPARERLARAEQQVLWMTRRRRLRERGKGRE